MNDEESFQAALDAHPDDHVTRGVFGDWLCDRDDPRGPGYQELARLQRVPEPGTYDEDGQTRWIFGRHDNWTVQPLFCSCLLPADWFRRIKDRMPSCREWCSKPMSRREAEDAAALAFTA